MSAAATGSEAIVRQFYDRAWNAEDLTAYDDLVTDDFVDHQAMPACHRVARGSASSRSSSGRPSPTSGSRSRTSSPRVTWSRLGGSRPGRTQGPLFGIPATGRPVRVTAMVVYRVEGGRLAEGWINRDDLGMMRQLGVVPTPG